MHGLLGETKKHRKESDDWMRTAVGVVKAVTYVLCV